MNRQIRNKFGNHDYAQEEWITELKVEFLFSELEMSRAADENHAAYIANWLTVLDNKYFIVSASSEACKAVEYMKELQPLKISL